MGYIVPVLKEKFINSKIIILHIEDDLDCLPPEGVAALSSMDNKTIKDFLEKEVPQTDVSRIRIIEWRPSLYFYKEKYTSLLSAAVEFIKKMDAENRTVAAFGKRWFRNCFKNLEIIQQTLLYRETDIPVIVTGSGPSLEEALPVIQKMQNKSLIISASSSLLALAHGNVTPDIIITADGGTWALQHIYPYFRLSAESKFQPCIAAYLNAALPSQCYNIPCIIINDGSLWQSIILNSLALPSVIIPQKGTVSAFAVELALLLSRGNIYIAGMDFSVRDIRTHVRPYGFDHLFYSCADRFSPVYSKSFVRSRLLREGGSLDIYAAWFKNQLNSWPKRIFSINGNHGLFENKLPAEKENVKKIKLTPGVHKKNSPGIRQAGLAALLAALKDQRYAENLKAELTPLLFAGQECNKEELEKTIIKLAGAADGLVNG